MVFRPAAALVPLLTLLAFSRGSRSACAGHDYEPGNRPDPFLDPRHVLALDRPEGLAGVAVAELRLVGLSRAGDDLRAAFVAADGQTYFAREGERLWDGQVATIEVEVGTVTLLERAADPGAASRYRCVRLQLR